MSPSDMIIGNREALILLKFGSDGSLHARVGHPNNLNDAALREFIRIFLASASICEAFHGGSRQTDDCDRKRRSSKDDDSLGKAVTVLLDTSTALLAAPTDATMGTWEGLIINPFPLYDTDVANALLPALRRLADDLVLVCDHDGHEKLFTLWQNIAEHVTSNWWGDDKRCTHLRHAVFSIAEEEFYGNHEESEDAEITDKREYLRPYAQMLREAIADVGGESHSEFCVLQPSMRVAYADRLSRHQTASVAWYYKHVVQIGSKSSHNQVVELSKGGMVRLWSRWKDWVFCAQFVSKIFTPTKGYQHVRRCKIALMTILADNS